jgi:SAM-dependent methyltransferase
VNDPDRNLWEVYVLEADTDHRGSGSAPSVRDELSHGHHAPAPKPAASAAKAEVEWEHRLGTPFPSAIPLTNASADRILLSGTLNAAISGEEISRILRETRRALRPGGRIVIHGLGADTDLKDEPVNLPGPAAAVERVPAQTAVIDALQSAGFSAVRLIKLSGSPVFRHDSVGLREILIEGRRFDSTPFDLRQTVLYQGPLREVMDDFGNVYVRGTPTTIPTPAVESLRAGPMAELFTFFPPGGER